MKNFTSLFSIFTDWIFSFLLFSSIIAVPVCILWNIFFPAASPMAHINYPQALALVIIIKLLLGSWNAESMAMSALYNNELLFTQNMILNQIALVLIDKLSGTSISPKISQSPEITKEIKDIEKN